MAREKIKSEIPRGAPSRKTVRGLGRSPKVEDPLLAIAGKFKHVWEGVDAVEYVRSLRDGPGSVDCEAVQEEVLRIATSYFGLCTLTRDNGGYSLVTLSTWQTVGFGESCIEALCNAMANAESV
jgi:hypothetical protein